MRKEYYKVLGIASSASQEEIRKAYHRLAKLYHPDISGNNGEYAELFKEINEAYHILSDPGKKNLYDLGITGSYITPKKDFDPYLIASTDCKTVLLNEEFEITYRYGGEGRVFKKPEYSSILYLSSPVVEHRNVIINYAEVKETWLTYTVCALMTGTIVIPAASIYINHKPVTSQELNITVKDNKCFFTKNELAGLNPYAIFLNKEKEVRGNYTRTFIYRRTVLIPRSAYAYFYHQIGGTLKIVFALSGLILSIINDFNILAGFLIGLMVGGVLCRSMYLLAGVKSRYYFALKYPAAVKYLNDDYKVGRDPAYGIFSSRTFDMIKGIFR